MVNYSQPTSLLLFPGRRSRSAAQSGFGSPATLGRVRALPSFEESRNRSADLGDASRSAKSPFSSFIRSRISSLRDRREAVLGQAHRLGRLGQQAPRHRASVARRARPLGRRWLTRPMSQRFAAPEGSPAADSGRRAAAGEPRQNQRARRFGNQPQIDERQRKAGALLGDHEVAVEQHGGADADRIAMDRGDDRQLRCAASARSSRQTGMSSASRGRAVAGNRRGRCRR